MKQIMARFEAPISRWDSELTKITDQFGSELHPVSRNAMLISYRVQTDQDLEVALGRAI